MTNEELVRQYYDGDETALEKLYHKNIGLIRGIAKETAAEFNCLMTDQHHPNQCSVYTKTILDDLCGEGALELLTRIQSREYDESRAVLTTYLYPHLKGRMTRWLEQNIGCMALSKDEMAAVRQMQRLYHVAWKDTGEIAEELGIPEARVSRYVRYNTHFLGVHDLVPVGYDGDPYERLMPGLLSASAEQAVYRTVCIELLRELFDTLPKKDRDIPIPAAGFRYGGLFIVCCGGRSCRRRMMLRGIVHYPIRRPANPENAPHHRPAHPHGLWAALFHRSGLRHKPIPHDSPAQ